MYRKLKNIASLLILLVFLLPTIVKQTHSHEVFICNAKHEKHLHVAHEKCTVCNFEFSVFSSNKEYFDIKKEEHTDNYAVSYQSIYQSSNSSYSFLLRAPPIRQS